MTRALPALVLLALTALAAAAPVVHVLEGRVVGVADGDTVTVLDGNKVQHKIRLAGIDAPEKDQPFGQRSKQSLSNAVIGKPVRVEWSKQDRYGRLVGKVWVTPASHPCASAGEPCPKTLDVGRAQLTVGLAWHFKRYENEQSEEDRLAYAFDEQEARVRKAGLWSDPDPTAPWDYRHGTAGGSVKKATSSGICHAPGTSGYSQTKKFTEYPTLEACLASGGRLPKNSK
jgi:endonuclease YncB( thermonuclease family)